MTVVGQLVRALLLIVGLGMQVVVGLQALIDLDLSAFGLTADSTENWLWIGFGFEVAAGVLAVGAVARAVRRHASALDRSYGEAGSQLGGPAPASTSPTPGPLPAGYPSHPTAPVRRRASDLTAERGREGADAAPTTPITTPLSADDSVRREDPAAGDDVTVIGGNVAVDRRDSPAGATAASGDGDSAAGESVAAAEKDTVTAGGDATAVQTDPPTPVASEATARLEPGSESGEPPADAREDEPRDREDERCDRPVDQASIWDRRPSGQPVDRRPAEYPPVDRRPEAPMDRPPALPAGPSQGAAAGSLPDDTTRITQLPPAATDAGGETRRPAEQGGQPEPAGRPAAQTSGQERSDSPWSGTQDYGLLGQRRYPRPEPQARQDSGPPPYGQPHQAYGQTDQPGWTQQSGWGQTDHPGWTRASQPSPPPFGQPQTGQPHIAQAQPGQSQPEHPQPPRLHPDQPQQGHPSDTPPRPGYPFQIQPYPQQGQRSRPDAPTERVPRVEASDSGATEVLSPTARRRDGAYWFDAPPQAGQQASGSEATGEDEASDHATVEDDTAVRSSAADATSTESPGASNGNDATTPSGSGEPSAATSREGEGVGPGEQAQQRDSDGSGQDQPGGEKYRFPSDWTTQHQRLGDWPAEWPADDPKRS
ncbi:MAG TPA: hypothetical protein VIL34_08865 [Actinopolymorphaceae bacterium]